MRSNIHPLTNDVKGLAGILREVEACAVYNGLERRPSLQLRLLAEELVGMLPELAELCDGEFWVENRDMEYELHVSARMPMAGSAERERLLSISKSGKNAAAKGIMGKIRAIAEDFLASVDENTVYTGYEYVDSAYVGMATNLYYDNSWTLNRYRTEVQQDREEAKEAWDELERSIVANLADDVIVGVKGSRVDIIVKKRFRA